MKLRMMSAIVTVAGFLFTTNSYAQQIDFQIKGINDSNGKLYVQLFKGEDNYQQGKAAAATIVPATGEMATVTFQNIEPGEYALRFFHDENDNGEMETNLFGMPSEGYGFSNNAKPNFGPVSYDEIKFSVAESEAVTTNTTYVIY